MPHFLYAQTAIQWAVAKSCNCIDKIDPNTNTAQFLHQGDSCLQVAIWQDLTGLSTELNTNLLIQDESWLIAARALSDSLLLGCSKYQTWLLSLSKKQLEDKFEIWHTEKGILVDINWKKWPATITLLDPNGELHDFAWINEFEGSTRFFKGIKAFELTEFSLVWKQQFLLNPSTKNYQFFKSIVFIKVEQKLTMQEQQQRYPLYRKKKR